MNADIADVLRSENFPINILPLQIFSTGKCETFFNLRVFSREFGSQFPKNRFLLQTFLS